MDGFNDWRTARVADLLSDFRTLQYYIAATPVDPPDMHDYYTEGWSALRQCAKDGQTILDCSADVIVPAALGGPEEQSKAELQQILLDAYSRRHQTQKIYLRQIAAQNWIHGRETILQGLRPTSRHQTQLRACDQQLRSELAVITDEFVYTELLTSDLSMGRWTTEDPSLRNVTLWICTRPAL